MRRALAVIVLGSSVATVGSAQSRSAVTFPEGIRAPELGSLVRPKPAADSGSRRNYVLPAFEVLGFNAALNLVDRSILGDEYRTDLTTIRRNLRRKWVIDGDPYNINQFLHPYQGAMYQMLARSAGVPYWTSLLYSMGGSVSWEIAGERSPPSRNDFIASGIAGSFLGESLFRMANLLIENASGSPSFRRSLAATAISPSNGFNRLVFGDRFDAVLSSRGAAYYRRWHVGASGTTNNVVGSSTRFRRNEGLVELSMEYGLPGVSGYAYHRPFDYFAIQATGSTANGLENILTRGLLLGATYGAGDRYRGLWGLYGSYDYIAPQIFRVSSTAISLGTTGQRMLTNRVALQSTVLGGAGYAAVGTLHGTSDTDYHYGVAPQAVAATRLVFGDMASFDLTAREYFVSEVAAASTGGHDNIVRADVSFSLRIHQQRALAVRYQWTRRDAAFPGAALQRQVRGTLALFYTLLGHDRFGVVDWR